MGSNSNLQAPLNSSGWGWYRESAWKIDICIMHKCNCVAMKVAGLAWVLCSISSVEANKEYRLMLRRCLLEQLLRLPPVRITKELSHCEKRGCSSFHTPPLESWKRWVICSPTGFHTPPLLQSTPSFFASLLLLCFFVTFFFSWTLLSYHERLALYKTLLNDERRVTLSFLPSCPSLFYHD
jgi:hypothetical protein